MNKAVLAAAAVGLLVVGGAVGWASGHMHMQHGGHDAHTGHGGHGGHAGQDAHAGHGAVPAGASPSTIAFIAANDRMHAGMDIEFTGDADVDFLRGMIPHHVGAVEMAEIVLEYGTDPDVRELAEAIIAAQNEEIDWMRAWLAERGH